MGISHSIASTLYLFSAMKSTNKPLDNEEVHSRLKDYFQAASIPFIEVDGRYKGFNEQSFLINASHVPEEAIQAYCKVAGQESYLVLTQHKHGTMKAVLTYVQSGERDAIGYFRSVAKEWIDALSLDYTYRKDIDMYWIVWPTDNTVIGQFEEELQQALENRPYNFG